MKDDTRETGYQALAGSNILQDILGQDSMRSIYFHWALFYGVVSKVGLSKTTSKSVLIKELVKRGCIFLESTLFWHLVILGLYLSNVPGIFWDLARSCWLLSTIAVQQDFSWFLGKSSSLLLDLL